MKTYTVINTIRHAAAEQPLKDYLPGKTIVLSDAHAAPLLDAGDISGPVETKADDVAAPLPAAENVAAPVEPKGKK